MITAENTITRVEILKEFEDRAIEKLEKAIRKARKHGVDALSYSFQNWRSSPDHVRGRKVYVEKIDVVVDGGLPVFNGYEFLTKIESVEGGGLLFKNRPGFDGAADIVAARPDFDPCACDHCGTKRRRNETFFVREVASGKIIQIGRNCLKYFVGSTDVSRVIWHLNFIFEDVASEMDDLRGMKGEDLVEADFLIEMAFASIRRGDFGDAVKYEVMKIFSSKYETRKEGEALRDSVNDADREKTAAAIAWIKGMEKPSGDYFHNLKTILSVPYYVPNFARNAGLVISVAKAYLKANDAFQARAKAAESQFIGEVGGKLKDVTLTLKRKINIGSFAYGAADTIIYIMADAAGNTVTWKSAAGLCLPGTYTEMDVEATFKASFSVKAHEVYKNEKTIGEGVKQTKVLRLKVTEVL